MNKKIERVRSDIAKMQKKIREDEEYLKVLRTKERQLENEEIIASVRSMQAKGRDVLEVLNTLQNFNDNVSGEDVFEDLSDDDEVTFNVEE